MDTLLSRYSYSLKVILITKIEDEVFLIFNLDVHILYRIKIKK